MRNLKKFLALALAVMMVFSLFVTVNAADAADTASTGTKFTDLTDADKAYQPALEALGLSGAMQGYDDGSFAPNKSLTRKEYAVILFRIAATAEETTEANLAKWAQLAVATYSDIDNPNAWYASAVGYLYENKIMVGVADGVFADEKDPTIKGREAFITLLRALGLVVNNNEFTDSDPNGYNPQAAIDRARGKGLDAGLTTADNDDSVLKGAITRQTVAQLMANALVATGWHYTNTDANGVPQFKENVGKTLGAKFGLTTVKESPSAVSFDPFRRPAVTDGYVVGGEVIVTKRESALVGTFTGKVTGKNITDKIGTTAAGYPTWSIVTDGEESSDSKPAATDIVANSNGVTEVYVNSKDKTVTVVVINKYVKVLTAGDIVAATKKAKAHIVLDTGLTHETEDYAKDDVVVYTYGVDAKGNKVVDTITKVEDTATGKLTSIKGGTPVTYTIGGTAYPQSTIIGSSAAGTTLTSNGTGKEYTVWLYDGAIVYAKLADEDDGKDETGSIEDELEFQFVFALASKATKTLINGDIIDTATITGIDTSGNLKSTLKVCEKVQDDNLAALGDGDGDTLIVESQIIVLMECDDADHNGCYVMYTLEDLEEDDNLADIFAAVTEDVTIDGTPTLVSGPDGLYADASTMYYVAQYVDEEGQPAESLTETGKVVAPKKYTGYAAIGDLENAEGNPLNDVTVIAIDLNDDGVADVVFLDAYDAPETHEYAYVLSNYTKEGKIFYYDAIVGGEAKTLELSSAITGVTSFPALVQIDTDADGKVTGKALAGNSDTEKDLVYLNHDNVVYTVSGELLKRAVGTAKAETWTVISANTPVYIYNDGEVTEKTMGNVKSFSGVVVIFKLGTNGITAVYVDETAERADNQEIGAGEKAEVGGVQKGEKIKVSGEGAELEIKGDVEEGADITTDDISKVKKPAGTVWNEAVKYEPEEEAEDPKWGEVEDGSLFVMDGDKAGDKSEGDGDGALSNSKRREFCFVFSTDADHGTYTITLTHGKRTLTWTKEEDKSGKYLEMVCPAEINDGTGATSNNKYVENGVQIGKTDENNKLDEGYWKVSVKDSAGHTLFTGGFTVTAADRVLKG